MRRIFLSFLIVIPFAIFVFNCGGQTPIETIKSEPVDNLDQVISKDGIEFDQAVSTDGNGSIKINADSSVVNLYEFNDIDVENALLTYQAKVKTEDFRGIVFLEMWCGFEGIGEFFSRDLASPTSGSSDWKTQTTFFMLEKGQNPQVVKLNVVINGTGTVWVDDIKLIKGPLE